MGNKHSSKQASPASLPPAELPTTDHKYNTINWTRIQKLKPTDAHTFTLTRLLDTDPTVSIKFTCACIANGNTDPLAGIAPDPNVPIDNVMLYQGSETDTKHLYPVGNGFFTAISEAWATHGNIVLSPDDVWIAIQLQYCRYMEANAEALRYTFVDHEGKEALAVDECDWSMFMEAMMTKIQEKVKNDVADDFLPHFSTSTPLQTSLKHLAVMDSMQRYFSYHMICGCGIEQVGLLGTLDDWNMLRGKVNGLKKFHLNEKSGYFSSLREWVDDLLVIVDQFINTYQGKPNTRFWNRVMSESWARAGSGGATMVDGWLLTFLVGNYKQKCDIQDIPSLRFNVPVQVDHYEVRVVGGFTGVIRDEATNTYYPQHSFSVIRLAKNNATGPNDTISSVGESFD